MYMHTGVTAEVGVGGGALKMEILIAFINLTFWLQKEHKLKPTTLFFNNTQTEFRFAKFVTDLFSVYAV